MKYKTHENIHDEVDKDDLYKIDKMSHDDKYWQNHAFESKLKYIYDICNQASMTSIHENKVNKIAEWNLQHDIINTSKQTKTSNRHYYPILNVSKCWCKGLEETRMSEWWNEGLGETRIYVNI